MGGVSPAIPCFGSSLPGAWVRMDDLENGHSPRLRVWGQSWGSPRTFFLPLWPLPSGPQRPALMTGMSFSGILGLSLCPGSFPARYHHCDISVPIPKLCAPLTPTHALPPSDILPALPLLSLALPALLLLYLRPRPVASPGRLLTLLNRLSGTVVSPASPLLPLPLQPHIHCSGFPKLMDPSAPGPGTHAALCFPECALPAVHPRLTLCVG